jgi:peptidoglycan/xylan/chitin deacetylase (PgdA/CDA1 family)
LPRRLFHYSIEHNERFENDKNGKYAMIHNMLGGVATIFIMHRILPFEEGKLPPNENMKVSREFLEDFIVSSKKHGYSFISLDRLYEILIQGENTHKNIVMTLDDGYKDTYTYAYPIFKKHNIPFAVYLMTSLTDNKAALWWYPLENLVVQNSEIQTSDGIIYSCASKKEKIKSFMSLRKRIIALPKEGFLDFLSNLFPNYKIDWFEPIKLVSMTWEDVLQLSHDPIVTIGAHTVGHFALNLLSREEIINEVNGSKKAIEEKIEKPVEHFCYPFGSRNEVDKREFTILKEIGFKTATTTRFGNIFYKHKEHLEALPRVMLTECFSWNLFYLRSFMRSINTKW